MEKFKTWLNETPGMQTTLVKAVGSGRSWVSRVKHGHRPMPLDWFELVIKLSGDQFTYEELTIARIKTQAALKKLRAAARESPQGETT